MDNQQPSTLEDRLRFLAINAKFGDGQLWKHPETKNYKVIYTSTTPELLEVKQEIAPEVFTTGIKPYSTKNHSGRYKNAKQMYRLASIVHPVFTEVANTQKQLLFKELTVEHFGLWYLDDGTAIKRENGKSYRIILSIGDTCNTEEKRKLFEDRLRELYGDNFGRIYKNNSKATENNKVWIIPKPIALQIINEAKKYGIMERKLPLW